MSLLQRYWQVRFARWGRAAPIRDEGYTVLVPVPGDLPVFLDLALAVCRAQVAPNRVATIVIPDVATGAVDSIVARARVDWPGRLEQLALPVPERWTLPRLGDPGRNHAVQLNTAIARTTATHAVLHDADLFLLAPDIHERQWAYAVDADLDVLGIDPAWDGWYAGRGLGLAATWEMTARTAWLRSFPPWRHIAHDDDLNGAAHTFDTTFWAQTRTPGNRIAVRAPGGVVHFNYVISTYRKYRSASRTATGAGPGYRDSRFRLLLIRVLIDTFDSTGTAYGLPSITELAAGLDDPRADVWYAPADATAYAEFRPRLAQILAAFPPPSSAPPSIAPPSSPPPSNPPSAQSAVSTPLDVALAAFDAFYGELTPVPS